MESPQEAPVEGRPRRTPPANIQVARERAPRRERGTLIGTILEAIHTAQREEDRNPTRVAQRCNLSYDRFAEYVQELRAHGMLLPDPPLRLTPAGVRALQAFVAWRDTLSEFGIDRS